MKPHDSHPETEQFNALFTNNIHLIADGPLSDNIFALKARINDDDLWWLLPFKPELLTCLDLEALREPNSDVVKCVRSSGSGESFLEVTVTVGGIPFSRRYGWRSANRDMTGTNALDVRIWPSFRFLTAPKLPAVDRDRVHYMRVRQQAEWGLRPQIIARSVDDGAESQPILELFKAESWDPGWPDDLEPHAYRMASCYAFPATGARRSSDGKPMDGEWEPIGLSFEGRGICLFKLVEPFAPPHGQVTPLRIGVNVGTANTCVTSVIDVPGVESPAEEIHFVMQTLSLHLYPRYDRLDEMLAREQFTEGAAAVLDFPYKYADDAHVTEQACFPTRWVTRLPEGAAPLTAIFQMSNGLIFGRDLCDFKDIRQLLNGYPPAPIPDYRPFRVVSDILWANRSFRMPFFWHLYKMIVYHAAWNGARISSVTFSFPRPFTQDEVHNYRSQLCTIFHDHGQLPLADLTMMTESDAMLTQLTKSGDGEPSLVFDIGKNVTDLLGLFPQRRFQVSYKFAAGLVNQYFTSSPPLQHMFEEALWRVLPTEQPGTRQGDQQADRKKLLQDLFAGQGGPTQVPDSHLEQGFFSILGMLEDRQYPLFVNALQSLDEGEQNQARRKALCGFFYTLVLLYTGMVYQTGRLLRLHNIRASHIKVRLMGNGSRFYRFLSPQSGEFDEVLQRLLHAGYQSEPACTITLEPESKSLVAKGLLASRHGERAQVIQDPESHDHLLKWAHEVERLEAEKEGVPPPGPEEFEQLLQPDLIPFLEALNRELPNGQCHASTVIPFCMTSLADEARRLFPGIIAAVFARELSKAKEFKVCWDKAQQLAKSRESAEGLDLESALTTEPVFMIRLKCLMEGIRRHYANCE